jgi:hypothetical protein
MAQAEIKGREAARGEARPPVRPDVRPEQRPPQRLEPGQFIGRDGEILSFARGQEYGADEFHVPEEMKEPGWSYQWIAATVHNKPNHGEMREMMANGWRPVKPTQLGGYFERYAEGRDHIEYKGLILMERPEAMTEAARERDRRAADAQFGRHLKRVDSDVAMPKGFAFDPSKTQFRRGEREEVPSDLKPRYRAQVTPAGDE